MPIVTYSKARWGQLPNLAVFPDGERNRSRKVAESREGNGIVAGHEEVRSLSATCAAANGSQSSPGFDIFKYKDKRCLISKCITEHKLKSLHKT